MSRRVLGLGFALVCVLLTVGCKPVVVPNVVGMTQVAATTTLVAEQLVVGELTTAYSATVPLNCVISQEPTAGTRVDTATGVALVVSLGRQPALGWSYIPSPNSIWGLTVDNTAGGGFIIGGGYHNSYDMYALNLNATGGKVWDKPYSNRTPDSNNTELWRHEARGARQTSDGGYILLGAGHFYKDLMPEVSYLLVKTDSTGKESWSKAYAPDNPYDTGNPCVENQPAALQVTDDGGYVAFGDSYVGHYSLASILKTKANGDVEFLKVINDNGKAYEEQITGGQQTLDHGYVLAGYSDNGAPHGPMALLIKLDEDGELQWSKTYQYVPDNHGAEAFAVTQTADGGYVFGGELINDITKASTYGFWMTKVDGNGDQIWANAYGHSESIHYSKAICETPQGDLIAAGALSSGEMAISKFTSDGDLLWNFSDESLPSATANAITLTDDGGCVVVGSGISGGTVIMKVNDVYHVD